MVDDQAFKYEGNMNIPKQRIGVIIGKKGSTKRKLERELNSKLVIEDQKVYYSTNDPVTFLKIRDVIKAIARGFTPEEALMLLDDNYTLYVINLEEKFGKNKERIIRYKSRVIGREGSVRKQIEEKTNTKMVVYGKTISLLGRMKDIRRALDVINLILKGSRHSTALNLLNRRK